MSLRKVYSQTPILFISLLVLISVHVVAKDPIFGNIKIPQHLSTTLSKNIVFTKIINASKTNRTLSNTTTSLRHRKKWQVGRVSRKSYEIVNVLWRKTNIFLDIGTSTMGHSSNCNNISKTFMENPPRIEPYQLLQRPLLPISTPSFIEFYYLDESDEQTKEFITTKQTKHTTHFDQPLKNFRSFKLTLLNPVFAFHVHPYFKRSVLSTRVTRPTNNLRQRKVDSYNPLNDLRFVKSLTLPYEISHKLTLHSKITTPSTSNPSMNPNKILLKSSKHAYTNFIDNETCPLTTGIMSEENVNANNFSVNFTHNAEPTTVYDKIRFFEMYDLNTHRPIFNKKTKSTDEMTKVVSHQSKQKDQQKILLEHIDQNIGHSHDKNQKAKHSKKHIVEQNKDNVKYSNSLLERKKLKLEPVTFNFINKTKFRNILPDMPLNKVMETSTKVPYLKQNLTKFTAWSNYPFASVYIYEPLQVLCDAGAISPHWLVTAGSCLLRHHKKPGGMGQSAFVTYCGAVWWNPERIAYVKYSVVHPQYHSREKTRRHIYNLGLIQVVTSMASACTGWAPISLISHHFFTSSESSTGVAVGWGLDRFDPQYPSSDLPKLPLSVYESRVYSDSCPGNTEYSKAKRLEEFGGTENVYCLSLPSYKSEETDPVHGGLLLVGGKLIAVYLQEERRSWGEQCAEYTGTWRLVPWVLDVAREPDEPESFTVDI